MLYLLGQIVFCLLIAALLGALIGWFFRAIVAVSRAQDIEDNWQNKLKDCESRLETRDAELMSANQSLQQLKDEMAQVDGQRVTLQTELDEADADIRDLSQNVSATETDFVEYQKIKEEEIKRLQWRIAELEQQTGQLERCDASLQDMEGRLTATEAEKDEVLFSLQARIRQLEPLPSQVQERDNRIRALQGEIDEHNKQLEKNKEEVTRLQGRIAELESSKTDVSMQSPTDRCKASLAEKEAEVIRLSSRLAGLERVQEEVRKRDAVIQALESDLQSASKAKDTESFHNRSCVSQLQEATSKIQEQNGEIISLKDKLAATFQKKDEETNALEQKVLQLENLARQAEKYQSTIHYLESKYRAMLAEKDDAISRLKKHVTGRDVSQERQSAKDQSAPQVDRLEENTAGDTTDSGLTPDAGEIFSLRQTLQTREHRIKELEDLLDRSGKASEPNAPAERPQCMDDLKIIHGIGPMIEQTLNRQGITTFRQIAEFTQEDIERVSGLLENFKDRVMRDDWVGQAKRAHYEKYGEKLHGGSE